MWKYRKVSKTKMAETSRDTTNHHPSPRLHPIDLPPLPRTATAKVFYPNTWRRVTVEGGPPSPNQISPPPSPPMSRPASVRSFDRSAGSREMTPKSPRPVLVIVSDGEEPRPPAVSVLTPVSLPPVAINNSEAGKRDNRVAPSETTDEGTGSYGYLTLSSEGWMKDRVPSTTVKLPAVKET